MTTAATFAAVTVTLYAGHQLADHVLGQTDAQAAGKAAPGWAGWRWCLAHVGQYHLVLGGMLAAAVLLLGLDVSGWGVAAGLGFSAVTHAFLDRRWPVRWLLRVTGSEPFSRLASGGLNGMYMADQACHYACLWVAALLVVIVGG